MFLEAILLILFAILVCFNSTEIDADTFRSKVLTSDEVYVVKFYSAMCGSCKEFNPAWERFEEKAKNVETAKINIDNKDAQSLAKELGILKEGIPNVRAFTKKGSKKGVAITQDVAPYKTLFQNVKKVVKNLPKRESDNKYLRK
jgi:thiol-disulfide isomerase/thioredoxin